MLSVSSDRPDRSIEELFQDAEVMQNAYRERLEFVQYFTSRKGRSLVEDYLNGSLAIVLDLNCGSEINVNRPFGKCGETIPTVLRAVLVLYADARDTPLGLDG